jgi:hypothetical protein
MKKPAERDVVTVLALLHMIGLYTWGMVKHPVETAAVALVWLLACLHYWQEEAKGQ